MLACPTTTHQLLLIWLNSEIFRKIREKGGVCKTIPVISPSNKKMDYYLKLNAYQDAGVREYWVIDPEKKAVVVYDLEKSKPPVVYHFEDKVPVGIFEDVVIDFS